MFSIHNTSIILTEKLNEGKRISVSSKGLWEVDNCFMRVIHWIFQSENKRIKSIISTFNKFIDKQETDLPIALAGDQHRITYQTEKLQQLQNLATAIENYSDLSSVGETRSVRSSLDQMHFKMASLRYRMGAVNGGLDPRAEPDPLLILQVTESVARWKNDEPLFHGANKQLNDLDRAKINEFCRYPEFSRYFINNHRLAVKFFKIAIRDQVDVKSLIEFNDFVSKKLYDCHMTCRIGAFSQKLLSVDASDTNVKQLNLLFEGRKINVLDQNQQVTFSDGFITRVKDVFDSFKNLNDQPSSGEFEYFYDGIRRWNAHQWGPQRVDDPTQYNSIDVSVDNWWDQPNFPLYDTIERNVLERKYNIRLENDQDCVQVLEATRNAVGITLQGHGYNVFYIPTGNGTTYKVLPLGLYSDQFPTNWLEKISFIGDTVPGTIVFPDPNYTYTLQKASIAKKITREQLGLQLKRIAHTRQNGGWFMWSFENCCFYAKNLFRKILAPNDPLAPIIKKRTFKVLFLDSKPDGFINLILWIYKQCQNFILKPLYEEFTAFFLSTRRELRVRETILSDDGDVQNVESTKSAYSSKFGQKQKNNLPAVFHTHVENNEIPGAVLTYGHERI